jgi:hypothetical protein
VGKLSPVWNKGLDALRKLVTSTAFVRKLATLQSAQRYAEHLSSQEGRYVPESLALLAAAGVVPDTSKLRAIQWLHHPSGAASMSDSAARKMMDNVRKGIDLYLTGTEVDDDPFVTASVKRTTRLKERSQIINNIEDIFK